MQYKEGLSPPWPALETEAGPRAKEWEGPEQLEKARK